jgi:natural product biosynthesis luciferase-like monooxygenase protein/amino acid adenylation domain-containing protein
MARLSGQDDIVTGTPVANRQRRELEPLIGLFVNTLALRVKLEGDPSVAQLLAQVRAGTLAAYSHADLPFEQVVEVVKPPRSLAHSPLFQTLLTVSNMPNSADSALAGVAITPVEQAHTSIQFDLALSLNDTGTEIGGKLEYSSSLFDATSAQRIAEHFQCVLAGMLADENARCSELPLLAADQQRTLLTEFNNTNVAWPAPEFVHRQFEILARMQPDASAVVMDGAQLSYAELNARANRLAHRLIGLGIRPDERAAIYLERSIDMLVAILGVLKAGAAYVPLDSAYPEERLAFMLDDSAPRVIITQRELCTSLPARQLLQIVLDSDAEIAALAALSVTNPVPAVLGLDSRNLAYVIYTSGSTGIPKGVMVEHHSLCASTRARAQVYTSYPRFLLFSAVAFDSSVAGIFGTLCHGGCLVLLDRTNGQDPRLVAKAIREHRITTLLCIPSFAHLVVEDMIGAGHGELATIIVAGEACPVTLVRSIAGMTPAIALYNEYGPTESTVWATVHPCLDTPLHSAVSIGRPIANTQIHILDGRCQPVPIGVTGELYIGGAGLARGYLNRPELSGERFVDNPFAHGTRLYRTGDLGRWRADGTIDYVGRNDFQVKLRGFRIELGEIEARLRACAGVRDSVVAVREDGNGDKRLAAYLIGDETAARDNKMAFSLFYFGADNYARDNKYKLFLGAAQFADQNGFEAVWTPERHFNEVGALYPNPALLSAALATVTHNIHLRAGSVVSPLHHPVRIAEEWSVVDNLSAGRVGISLASGWHPRDFILAPKNFSERKEIMGQHVDALRTLWRGEAVAFDDGNGKSVPIQLFPAPVQSQLPLWITSAGNPETFVMAGRLGTNVLTHLLGQSIEDVAKNIALYRAALAEHGFDPAAGRVTLMIHTFVGEDFDATLERARKPFQDYMRAHLGLLKPLLKSLDVPVDEVSEEHVEGITAFAFERYSRHASLIGTVQSCLPVLNALRAAGVDEVACLIDWMNGEDALSGLPHLQQLHASSWKTVHDPKLLLAQLKTSVPDYMLPSSFTFLDSFPLTPNGKLDRKALPAPDMGAVATFRYEAPRPGIEQRVAAIWSALLNVERVGRNDNFFELGGHSLMVVSLIERLRQQGLNADVRTMFAASTLAELAERIQCADLDAAPFATPPNPITPDTTVLRPDLLPLVDLTQEEIDRIVAHSPGAVSNIQDIYPLAPLQQGMLFHHLLTPEGDAYLSATMLSFDKRERLDSFLRALQGVIDRHDILRTALYWEGVRQPVQIVYRKAPLVVHELAIGPGENALEELRLRADPHQVRIDMQRAPLLLGYVAREPGSDTFYLSLLNHHMVCDHVTLRFVLAEIEQLLRGNGESLPNSLPYRNFIARTTTVSESEHVNYFRNLLGDVERPTVLYGLTNIRGNGSGVRGAKLELDAALATRIRSVARAHSVTPAVLFHVAWAMVLGQCSGSDDVMFGTVLSGRMQGTEGADVVLGMFINTLPVRVRIGERVLREVVETTYAQLSALLTHEQATLALIQRCSKVPVSAPLFTALFNYRHTKDHAGDSERAILWDGVSALGSVERTNYPISISVDDLGQGFSVTSLCDGVDPELLLGYLNAAIHNLTLALDDDPDTSISRLDILPDQERRKVIVDFNRTAQAFSSDLLAHQAFESQVEVMGEAPAVIYGDVVLSYRELNLRANQLAHYLIGLGVQPDERIAICAPRSPEMIVAMLAVLKSGAAYVPLDPAMPDERLSFMIKDSAARILLTQHAQRERFDGLDSTIVLLDRPGKDVAAMLHDNPAPAALHAGSLAYVIYTSGSTGLPKGVMVQHDGLHNYLQWAIGHYAEEGVCHSIVSSPFAFDATITSLYTPLLTGGNTVLVPEGQELSLLAAMLRQDSVRRLIKITPAHLRVLGEQLSAEGIRPSRHLYVVGGEALPLSTVAMWHDLSPDSRLINEYGPTETVVGCCVYEADDGELGVLENMPIGRPIANTQMYILDNYLRPTPIGVPGEIYIGGAGVARGYLQRPELTTRHFIDDPFGGNPQGRLYRTGDLARWLDDGNIDYLGRNDFQVKIRGFRIEIGEVEAVLNACAEIHHAIVIARETSPGDKRLVAYLIKRDGVELDIAALRSQLALRLADYMIPSAFVCVESFPLTANGKLDRAALPAPDLASMATREYEPPTGAVEIALAKIWHDVLRIDHFGRHDEFFELGGHSLLAVQVAIKIRDIFSVDVPLAKVFEHTSIASLSELIMSIKLVQFEQEDIQSEADDIDQLSELELLALLEQERALMRT